MFIKRVTYLLETLHISTLRLSKKIVTFQMILRTHLVHYIKVITLHNLIHNRTDDREEIVKKKYVDWFEYV